MSRAKSVGFNNSWEMSWGSNKNPKLFSFSADSTLVPPILHVKGEPHIVAINCSNARTAPCAGLGIGLSMTAHADIPVSAPSSAEKDSFHFAIRRDSPMILMCGVDIDAARVLKDNTAGQTTAAPYCKAPWTT